MSIFDQPLTQYDLSDQVKGEVSKVLEPLTKKFVGRNDLMTATDIPFDAMKAEISAACSTIVGMFPPIEGVRQMPDDNSRWVWVSAIQKYIRRGMVTQAAEMAMGMVHAGHSSHMWKRLAVIAVEDVGMADPYGMTLVLHMAGYKTWRNNYDERVLVNIACTILADGAKSRDQCDLTCWCTYAPTGIPKDVKNSLDPNQLSFIANDPERSLKDRLFAWWAIFGQLKLPGMKVHRMQAYKDSGVPSLIAYMAERGKTVSQTPLTFCSPLIWEMMKFKCGETPDLWKPRSGKQIKGAPSYAYDMHTFQGKISVKYFAKSNQPVREFIDEHIGWDIDDPEELQARCKAIQYALFWAEGAVVDRRFDFVKQREMLHECIAAEGESVAVPKEIFPDLITLLHDQLEDMDRVRTKIVS